MAKQATILIADDTEMNRDMLSDILCNEYEIVEATNGIEAIEALKKYDISLVLLDIIMPEMNGFEVLKEMKQHSWGNNIPVIIISSETSVDFIRKGFEYGVSDYINRPFLDEIILQRAHNTIMLHTKQEQMRKTISQQIIENERSSTLMVNILSSVVEFRNGESGLHVIRIRIITEIMLETLIREYPQYGITKDQITLISNSAALHDIGKISIPEEILNKPGKLTQEEFEVMKTHTTIADEMLKNIKFGQNDILIKYCKEICRWHHERWDGNGYPDGLKGNEIPIAAQIVSLADVYDALVSERVYKPPYSHQDAVQMIINGECGNFNPDLIKCFLKIESDLPYMINIRSKNQENILSQSYTGSSSMISPYYESLSLESEHTKSQLLSSLFDGVIFEYDASSDTLVFSGQYEKYFQLPKTIPNFHSVQFAGLFFDLNQREEIYQRIKTLSPKNPTIQMRLYLNHVKDSQGIYQLTITSIWEYIANQEKIKTVVGTLQRVFDGDTL